MNGSCNCPTTFHAYLGACHRDVHPKGSCVNKSDCEFGKAWEDLVDCIGGVCTCSFRISSDRKMCVLAYGSNSSVKVKNTELLVNFFIAVYILRNIRCL